MRQKLGVACTVSKNRYHAREAAAALLKIAKATSDPAVAAGLIEAAVKLKDEAGELPPSVSVKAPDVQPTRSSLTASRWHGERERCFLARVMTCIAFANECRLRGGAYAARAGSGFDACRVSGHRSLTR